MTLHLVRLSVDLAGLARIAGERGWARGRRQYFDDGAALHHVLGETFGAAALQPFRLMVAPRQRQGRVYAYTSLKPAELIETAGMTATPEVVAMLAPAELQAKPMPQRWQADRRIGFDVRLRPTVRLSSDVPPPDDRSGRRDHGFAKGAEIDAYLAEALKHPSRDAMARDGRTRERVYQDWLARRFAEAATLEEARLAGFRRGSVARGNNAQEAPDVVMYGTLRVKDAERFAQLLAKGIGRHRAYGYGMCLLRPPAANAG